LLSGYSRADKYIHVSLSRKLITFLQDKTVTITLAYKECIIIYLE